MSSDIPVVTIDYVHYSCSAVSSNNVKCMGELLDYIISMGHKKSLTYMDRIFRVLHVTGWQHITGHLRSME